MESNIADQENILNFATKDFEQVNQKLGRALLKFSEIVNAGLSPDDTFESVLNELKTIISYDSAAIYYLNADGFELKKEAGNNNFAKTAK